MARDVSYPAKPMPELGWGGPLESFSSFAYRTGAVAEVETDTKSNERVKAS